MAVRSQKLFLCSLPKIRLAVALTVATTLVLCAASGLTAAADRSDASAFTADVRQVILMLDRPLHVRLRVSLGGQSLRAVRQAYMDKLFVTLDADGDGNLTHQEASRSPLLRRQERTGASAFLRSLASKQTVSRDEVARMVERVAGEAIIYRQDDSASESDLFIFELLDADGSGVIDQGEITSAADRLRQRDQDRDECVGFDEIQPPEPVQPEQLVVVQTARGDRPRATFAEVMRDTREPLLPRRMLRKYDHDGNAKLSPDELGWSRDRVVQIDGNGDGQLSANELRHLAEASVDLDIAVDVAPRDAGQPELKILESAGQHVVSRRPGTANVTVGGATLTVSYRHVDPVPAAIDNAMRRFNLLDVDGNGYLDEEEVVRDVRLRRGLFDMIDTDGDKKVFGEEMRDYVRLRAEPDATSCRVNIYDTGSGFFQSLDQNNDGRISQRELRGVGQSLEAMQRDNHPGVSLEEPARRFHLELVRGSFQMFGATDQMVSPTVSPGLPATVGPIWFQRMDRNNDGDLTWNEFLGHREDFYRLDVDRDELIDPFEAEAAEADQ